MSDRYILTVLDTPGIQPYIFSSNRLRENVGASHLVYLAGTRWPLETLRNLQLRTNLTGDGKLDESKHIEEGELDAEVIYVGGGNVTLLFRDRETARKFVRAWSRKVIAEAPGLTPAAAFGDYPWGDILPDAIKEAMKKLKEVRLSTPPSVPLPGLGVTVEGGSTGKPAVMMIKEYPDSPARPVSAEVAAKLGRVEEANERLRRLLPKDANPHNYTFALETDNFGRKRDEKSYLAIVHADGNGVGDYFRGIKQEGSPRQYIKEIRKASHAVNEAAREAQRQLLDKLLSISPNIYDSWGIELEGNNLPFRPIVFGGDDFTFISDGRLGLTLAAYYLKAFEEAAKAHDLPLKASAGIAIVKTHYPFARAYRLSEALTASAKQYARACSKEGPSLSALDWHFAPSGLMGTLEEIREREYRVDTGWLHMRPILLQETPRTWRTWPNFQKAVEHFKKTAQEHRNKVIALRSILREGEEAVSSFLATTHDLSLPKLSGISPTAQERGWNDSQAADCAKEIIPRSPYFDAIEAMDFYQPLSGSEEKEEYGNEA